MTKGKVIIVAGNKRAGKTTLTIMLHDKYNYNYNNFDMLLDSIEASFPVLNDHNDDKYISLLNEEDIIRGLEELGKMRERRMKVEISDQKYIEWKINYNLYS